MKTKRWAFWTKEQTSDPSPTVNTVNTVGLTWDAGTGFFFFKDTQGFSDATENLRGQSR